MNIEEVPFHKHIGIRRSSKPEFLLEMGAPESDFHHNHVGTIHAAAISALAEASTGEFLLRLISKEEITAVVCRSAAKYTGAARGVIRSRIESTEEYVKQALVTLQTKQRTLVDIETSIFTESDDIAAKFSFTWMLSRAALSSSG